MNIENIQIWEVVDRAKNNWKRGLQMTSRQFSEQTKAVKCAHATDTVSNVSNNLEFECTGLLFHTDYYFAAIDMVEISWIIKFLTSLKY